MKFTKIIKARDYLLVGTRFMRYKFRAVNLMQLSLKITNLKSKTMQYKCTKKFKFKAFTNISSCIENKKLYF